MPDHSFHNSAEALEADGEPEIRARASRWGRGRGTGGFDFAAMASEGKCASSKLSKQGELS